MALVLGLGGCFARPTEEIILSPPRPSGTPQVHEERRDGEPELSAAVSNDLLDITVNSTAECQQVTVTPMVQDNFARQTASKKIQAGNVVGASVFLGIGTVALPNAPPVQVILGLGLLGIGSLFASAFVSNALRPHDTRETVETRPQRVESPFQPCQTLPARDAKVIAIIGRTVLHGTTGPDGHALFNLSSRDPPPDLLASPIAHIQRDRYGTKAIDVDLTPSTLFPKWKAAVEDAAKRQQDELDRHKASNPRAR